MKKKYSKKSLNEIYEAAAKIKRREPRLEQILSTDPYFSFLYARDVLYGRFEEGEATIVNCNKEVFQDVLERLYLKLFPEAKADWIAKGWITV